MLRENKDVFDVFVNKLPEMAISNNEAAIELCEPIVHFMFNDLALSQLNKKLVYISYQIGMQDLSLIPDSLNESLQFNH